MRTTQTFVTTLAQPWALVRFGTGPVPGGKPRRPASCLAFLAWGKDGLYCGGLVEHCLAPPGGYFRYKHPRKWTRAEVLYRFPHGKGRAPTRKEVARAKRALPQEAVSEEIVTE